MPLADVWLRPARAFDAACCARIVNDWIDATSWVPRRHTPGEIAWIYRERVFRDQRVTIAESRGEVAGFLALDVHDRSITSLYVAAAARGARLGAWLLDEAKTQAPRLSLWTLQANFGARRFYGREGFREARMSDGDNAEGMPDVELVWHYG